NRDWSLPRRVDPKLSATRIILNHKRDAVLSRRGARQRIKMGGDHARRGGIKTEWSQIPYTCEQWAGTKIGQDVHLAVVGLQPAVRFDVYVRAAVLLKRENGLPHVMRANRLL